jgi:3-oxoacyl-(acyl-carrier-protein) synthase
VSNPREQIVVTGVGAAIPGQPGDPVFGATPRFALDRLMAGDNLLSSVPRALRQAIADKRIVVRGETAPRGIDAVPQVAGRAGGSVAAELAARFSLDPKRVRAYDDATSLAVGAALHALADAGLSAGRLPDGLGAATGVVFASAFAGFDRFAHGLLTQHIGAGYLLEVTALGHGQLAEVLGATGPSLALNAACAGTSAGVCTAADWLRGEAGARAERVIVTSGDHATSDALFPWIAGGFLAAGAASVEADVTRAALPFDARRNGMLLGMGGAALVLETEAAARARGAKPQARLVADVLANAAFHGTRMDFAHTAETVARAVKQAESSLGPRASWVGEAVYVSHETFTPRESGAARREIDALRAAFGDAAWGMPIVNTKALTGHPMGVCLEDVVAIEILRRGVLPPMPHSTEPDPELGPVRLVTRPENFPARVVIRLAAGFGSQLAVTIWACP